MDNADCSGSVWDSNSDSDPGFGRPRFGVGKAGKMLKRSTGRLRLAGIAMVVLLASVSHVHARGDLAFPADLMDTNLYPGLRGILDNNGDIVHNCGNVLVHLTNYGLIGSAPGSSARFESAPSAQWPAGSETEYLWIAGLWIGAIKNAEPAVTTAVPVEYRPGLSELDRMYRTRDLAPGGARAPSPNADDDRDGKTDEDWLDGRDNDGDGLIDEDFAGISNQMFFCEYRDTDPNIKLAQPEHEPLGFLIQQSSLCWEDQLIDDFILFDYLLVNEGFEPLFDVYVGFYADADIGPREREQVSEDDWAGFWEGIQTAKLGTQTKNVKVSIGYMFDDDGDEGESEGYIGLMFLGAQEPGADQGPAFISLRNYRMFSGRASFEQGGDPTNDEERYRTLDGTAPKSLPPADPFTGIVPAQLAKKADDYRMVVSAGPFSVVEAGESLGFQAALVLGRGFEGLVANAVQAQLTYDGVYLDCDEDPSTGVSNRETAVCPSDAITPGTAFPIGGTWPAGVLPNASNVSWCADYIACQGQPPSNQDCWVQIRDNCEYINADCKIEEQTGFPTGVDGRECLINWLVGTAPPPPRMRVVSNENRVDIVWDNLSETTPDLRLNVKDFESYRVWRADNWTRPLGTDVNTGPGSNLWMLLSEFDLPRNNIGSDTGLESIRYTPAIPDDAVEFYREWFAAHPLLDPPDLPGFSTDELDTAKAMAQGVRYYLYSDPPLKKSGCVNNSNDSNDCLTQRCPSNGDCPPVLTSRGPVYTRCNTQGWCQEVAPPPHSGAHYFYSVTATDHKLDFGPSGGLEPVGPGLAGDPNSSFEFVNPPTRALPPEEFDQAKEQIYVVPNPATVRTMQPWTLSPNNDDPTGVKVEFHHLPATRGKVTVFTLSGDMVIELPFDNRGGKDSLAWDLLSRNGQEITSGIYVYSVEADHPDWNRFIGRFVVIR